MLVLYFDFCIYSCCSLSCASSFVPGENEIMNLDLNIAWPNLHSPIQITDTPIFEMSDMVESDPHIFKTWELPAHIQFTVYIVKKNCNK